MGNMSTVPVTDDGATGATLIASFFHAAASDGYSTTVVLRPITFDSNLASDVVLDAVALLDTLLLVVVVLTGVALLFELPPHPAARTTSAAIAPRGDSRRKMEDMR
jgi:hypothetical protein